MVSVPCKPGVALYTGFDCH